jgi:hypothetical protein
VLDHQHRYPPDSRAVSLGDLNAVLIGAAHLLFSDVDGTEPGAAAVGRVVATVLAAATR